MYFNIIARYLANAKDIFLMIVFAYFSILMVKLELKCIKFDTV